MARPPITPITIPAIAPPDGPDEVETSFDPAPGVCMIPPVILVCDALAGPDADVDKQEVSSLTMTENRLLLAVVLSGSFIVAMIKYDPAGRATLYVNASLALCCVVMVVLDAEVDCRGCRVRPTSIVDGPDDDVATDDAATTDVAARDSDVGAIDRAESEEEAGPDTDTEEELLVTALTLESIAYSETSYRSPLIPKTSHDILNPSVN